jgi:hypothetical protein
VSVSVAHPELFACNDSDHVKNYPIHVLDRINGNELDSFRSVIYRMVRMGYPRH